MTINRNTIINNIFNRYVSDNDEDMMKISSNLRKKIMLMSDEEFLSEYNLSHLMTIRRNTYCVKR